MPPRRDFWLFFGGQTVSQLGSAFTLFALPLLVYRLTGSAFSLAATTAISFLPYLLFGLLLGALVDSSNRRRAMIFADLGRALVIATIPLVNEVGSLHLWLIYSVSFVATTLSIVFDAGCFAAVPSIVGDEDLIAANGRLQAGAQTAQVIGPLLAGALLATGLPLASVLYGDAATFLLCAVSLGLIATSFGGGVPAGRVRLRALAVDVREGLGFVANEPVLRELALLGALVNFTIATFWSQLVVFAKVRLAASDGEIGVLWAAGSVGVVIFAVLARRIRRALSFRTSVLGAIGVAGVVTVGFACNQIFWVAVPLWAIRMGLGALWGINTTSLRQRITPEHMRGRIASATQVIAWSAIPAGALAGGWLIRATGDVRGVYIGIGCTTILLATMFSFGAVGRIDDPAEHELVHEAGTT